MELDYIEIAKQVIDHAKEHGIKILTAESCTGGMLSCYLTAIPGSSEVFDRGYITYTEKSKRDMLSVRAHTLKTYGAVSKETAIEMVQGLLDFSKGGHIGISITGVAGPGGGTTKTPVGLVYIGYGDSDYITCKKFTLLGDRNEVRQHATKEALKILLQLVKG